MSILVRFAPPGATTQQYDDAIRRLEESAGFPPEGLEYHVAFVADGSLRVSEVYESQEQFEAFGPRLMPVLAEVGIELGEPDILQIHNIVKR